MRRTIHGLALLGLGSVLFGILGCAPATPELVRSFENKSTVRIQTVSGNCIVTRATGTAVEVHLTYAYQPADTFEPVISEEGDQLAIAEHMRGSNSGHSTWTLAVPTGTAVHFKSASGSFRLSGLESTAAAETASGDIEVNAASGTFTLQSASGRVTLTEVAGKIQARSASGNVDARGVALSGSSEFSSASGHANVALAKSAAFDLDVSSASGSARLNYNNQPLQGRYELEVRKSNGAIHAPVPFEREEEVVHGGETYLVKSFHKGKDVPRIRIHSASGKAVLVER